MNYWLAIDGRLWSGPHTRPLGLRYAVFAGFSRYTPYAPIWVHNTFDLPERAVEMDNKTAEAEIMSYWPPESEKNSFWRCAATKTKFQ